MSITLQDTQINDALAIAADVHRGQVRDLPDGRPYLCHVMDVMNNVPANDHLARLVAILHDTIEDAAEKTDPETVKEIKREAVRQKIREAKFDDAVLIAVEAISHTKKHGVPGLSKVDEYLAYIEESVLPNLLATQVKIADNYVNMKDLVAAGVQNDEARVRLLKYARSIVELTRKPRHEK
jgi:(p)ppGpp synthase/HD superfamily hydrolase